MAMEVVNGYVCRNCTDVEFAKKGVDPAHPKDGPQGVYADGKAEAAKARDAKAEFGPAVTLGGQLAVQDASASRPAQSAPYVPGSTVNLSA
ncbi:MAG: hypothetical protein KKE02_16490 [Alphaproteobacteria bacterium]|nr:hypothetical protein [Alphaproteobacteria bacterium]MBU1515801.1 hypothetical protein [Alphaproteobacteria bacterium]MBU2094023.1 hypothetical protein [Alphaproteobacteria bacterium]MBU2152622.1 hypothetical protein [Alphaproteobacteria bacterium]MBU2308831.1 hypothetical protein [Alphaproteobacteria bacterium]